MAKIYVLHENDEWTAPLKTALEKLGAEFELWHLHEGSVNLMEAPPEGVFYNRMSASSHTRGHRYAPEYTAAVLRWLESYNRTVFNGTEALQLELSKAAQYTSLVSHGIRVPETIAASGKQAILDASKQMGSTSFITKHNRAGKGLGVHLFQDTAGLERYLQTDFEPSIDGITLLQTYINNPDSLITRCEFVNGKFLYAVNVDTSDGFELCPADVCQIDDAFCPTTDQPRDKFSIIPNFQHEIIEKYEQFLQTHRISFAGIEFIRDEFGTLYTYDVNTNTNYNKDAEEKVGIYGMKHVADQLVAALASELHQNA
ncbi:RimK family alpha-L-glutamate ligase [Geomicrobium sp. JSM 1781026]|uniref:ATP-grasp domain-containing protein n=1 Tax=Geomicrobium sp. JSM 1781026 TaxID=3344580 RepID=UPI0035C26B13